MQRRSSSTPGINLSPSRERIAPRVLLTQWMVIRDGIPKPTLSLASLWKPINPTGARRDPGRVIATVIGTLGKLARSRKMLLVISGSVSLQTSRDFTPKRTRSTFEDKLSGNNVKATLQGNLRISIEILSLYWIVFFLYTSLKLRITWPLFIKSILLYNYNHRYYLIDWVRLLSTRFYN